MSENIVYGTNMATTVPGRRIEVKGSTSLSSTRFTIYLQKGEMADTIPLYMSVRFLDDCIVRNTCNAGVWGKEERVGGMPLVKGQEFQITILCTLDKFKIKVNGQHFCDYEHRLPFHLINYLQIKGEVKVEDVIIGQTPTY